MTLDPRFVLCPPLQEYFVDKDTGEALSGGIVTFYKDDSRSILKPVYQLSGSPPYGPNSYVELNNPIILTSVGTFADDNGNDIVPYLFPYDGTPEDSEGNIELYYITVYSSLGVLQFTREAWPNTTDVTPIESNNLLNYVPNGQFLLHSNPDGVTPQQLNIVGRNASIKYIAQGGWSFEVPFGSASTNAITFERNISPQSNPDESADPRYSCKIVCSVIDVGDGFKDLCLKFPNVNKFAGVDNTYTLSFQGLSTTGNSLTTSIHAIKFFGTGGSSLTDTSLGTITINPFESTYNISFNLGDNAGKNIGTVDDDWIKFAIRLPNSISSIKLTDFVLTPGTVVVRSFPQTPDADFLSKSLPGWLPTPDHDGNDLFLPIILTQQGMVFDRSQVGSIITRFDSFNFIGFISQTTNELLCTGATVPGFGYSSLGIPFTRLKSFMFSNTAVTNVPKYGTGGEYLTAYLDSTGVQYLELTTNQPGLTTDVADGGIPTGFTFFKVHSGATSYGGVGYNQSNTGVTFYANFIGQVTAPVDVTSGMSITNLRDFPGMYLLFTFTALPANSLANPGGPGKYFTFYTFPGPTLYYMWFKLTNETDPAPPGGVGIQVNLIAGQNAIEVASLIKDSISASHVTLISFNAASTVSAGSYFSFYNTTPTQFVVWYKKDGVGTAPIIPGAYLMEVDILSADTAQTVAAKTQLVINSQFYKLPDLRGQFLRGTDDGAGVDVAAAVRLGNLTQGYGDHPATFQYDNLMQHAHAIKHINTQAGAGGYISSVGSTNAANAFTPFTEAGTVNGTLLGDQTYPVNISCIFAIKY